MNKYFALVIVLFLAACSAPAESPAATPLPPVAVEQIVPTATAEPAAAAAPTATEAAQPLQPAPQATSRGDKLVASDPATVQVGVGKPVLLEFFRFT